MESKKQGQISIIMPVYNGVSWIGECIESIRQQTDTNWELLVLDDHSTDGTTELVLKLAEADSRIFPILRQKNGVSAARNEGLEKAQGEFIMFVDADDKLDPQMLSVLRAMLGQTESDLAVCDYYRWNGKPDGVYNGQRTVKNGRRAGGKCCSGKKVLRADGTEKPGQKRFSTTQFVWRVSVYTIAQNMFRTISCAEIPVAGACYTAAVRLGKSVSGKT
ncbi:MAG: glycosyltransferase family 2 protein [Gallintestinimicrobium sp.]